MPKMKAHPDWLRPTFTGRPVGVDREADAIRGYVVAQAGAFKSDGRGEFDRAALEKIVELGNAARGNGLKSHFTHADMSSDGLGKLLGRTRDFTLGTTRDAQGRAVQAVRADLHFDPSAHETPSGDLAGYIMTLAENDPDALSSSLVLKRDEEYRLAKDGTPLADAEGRELPPLWRPTELHASDIVDTGDAVDGLLSAQLSRDALPLHQLWQGAELLDGVFAGQTRDVVEARLLAYLERYLSRKFGERPPPPPPAPTPRLDAVRARLAALGR